MTHKRATKAKRPQRGKGYVRDTVNKYGRPLALGVGVGALFAAGALPLLYESARMKREGQFIAFDNRGWPNVVSTF